METNQPLPGNLRLRYGTASVFERADTRSKEVAQLGVADVYTVLGADGEYYHVQLADGTDGYVYAANVVGTDMPLTASEQVIADDRAALASHPAGGWRGMLKRLTGK
jgi:hypothetical protein